MAQLIVTIPDEQLPVIAEAFAATYGYTPNVTDPETGKTSPNPQSALDFTKERVVMLISDVVKSYLVDKARREAQQAVENNLPKIEIS